jgi:diguanylate cyclase (GGDEF)-like protein
MSESSDLAAVAAAPTGSPPSEARVSVLLSALEELTGSAVALFVPTAPDVEPFTTGTLPSATVATLPSATVATLPSATVATLAARIRAWAVGADAGGEVATMTGPGWEMAVARSRAASGEGIGAVGVARHVGGPAGWSAGEISTVATFAGLCGSWVAADPAVTAGPALLSQTHLDALVTQIAVELMSVSAETLDDSLEWMLRVLSEFFEVDISYLRRTDFARDMTVLIAEWPKRENVPDPDPLGEVPFGSDPVFDAIRDLKEPFVLRPTSSPDSYQERVEQGSGIGQVSMAMVPLLRNRTTVGVLGFVKFGDRPWEAAETNALQAVASLMVQLEARIDAEERLQHLAYHDELTGLPNRRAVLEELERRLERDADQITTLLFLDLDRFKVLNDFLGHAAGDRLLGAVGERLRGAMAEGDFVARLAGDEFVLLVDRPAGDRSALQLAEGLLAVIAAPLEISGHEVSRTASVGAAVGDGEALTAEGLLAHGDVALHSAKAGGGNQVVVFDDELRGSVQWRSDTELLLRNAIDHGGLLLYYQPEINLRNGQLLAVEALVRWDHPQRGILAAGSFIKVAEETGLIVDLGLWVLEEACRQMAVWHEEYGDLRFTMRVNMSPAQLATRNIVQLVDDALTKNQLPGRLICFEITEHAVMRDVEQALVVLQDLKSLGVSLAIDDFGTGYSSMAQLKRLPVDVLKVDQTFVAGLGIDGGDRAIVDATVRLARAFGLETVAEGVETPRLVDELLSLGCYRAQGFLLCRPKPAADLIPILMRGGIDPVDYRGSLAGLDAAGPGADVAPAADVVPAGASSAGPARAGRHLTALAEPVSH